MNDRATATASTILIPYLGRSKIPVAACLVATVIWVCAAPQAELYIGGSAAVPRVVSPLEYAPAATGLVAAISLSSRFHDWERYGDRLRMQRLAMVNSLLPSILALGVFGLCLIVTAWYPTGVPAEMLLPYGSNVVVSVLVASILFNVVGRLAAVLSWVLVMAAVLLWQAAIPSFAEWLPFTMHLTADLTPDSRVRWVWIGLLAVTALIVARSRRGVPIRISLPDPDEAHP